MIDIHCHLLPGVDDGVSNLEMARDLCAQAAADGTQAIIATPHQRHPSWWNGDSETLRHRFESLQEAVADLVTVYLGAEVHLDSRFLEELDRGSEGQFLSLAGGRYLLLELPRIEPRLPPEEILHEVRLAGFQPILAHPEFIPYLAGDLDRVAQLVSDGMLLQVTAMSVTGGSGRSIRSTTWELLAEGWVHFIASDAHSPTWRPPGLAAARQLVAETYGEEAARRLTEANPRCVLEDRELSFQATL